ncbi:hypothetical protein [Arhodomonas aquaeolei]|uniref:hypothetical protein n=1 Tax=Arhodomonas aquaeolei TaxID=2369 RepID=UPI000365CAA8|nr:hypothetical protein [Arhodomonas aquaeolei]
MATHIDYGPHAPSLITFAFTLLAFASPASDWWSALAPPWYAPFALWALVIVAIRLGARRTARHEV